MSEMSPEYDVVEVENNGEWALKQFSTGKLLTKYIYSYIEKLGNGFFKVKKSSSPYYGIVRYDGIMILPCKFSEISLSFNNSYFLVERGIKKGLFNIMGEEILSCIYNYIVIEKDFIRIGKSVHKWSTNDDIKWGACDFRGRLLLDIKYARIVDIKKYGISKFDFDIYVISEPNKRESPLNDGVRPFPEQSVLANSHFCINDDFNCPSLFYIDKTAAYYVIVDEFGKAVYKADSDSLKDDFLNYSLKPIPEKYVEPITLRDGNLICKKRQSADNYLGMINVKGDVILPFKFNVIKTVPNTLFTYQVIKDGVHDIYVQNNDSGLCEKLFKGKYCKLEYCGYTGEFAIVYSTNNKCGLVSIDKRKKIIPCIYDDIYMENHQIIALKRTTSSNKYKIDIYSTEQRTIIRNGCIDIKSNPYYYGFCECEENSWIPFGDRNQISIAVNMSGKWQLLNANLEDVGLPLYDDIEFFRYGVYCYEDSIHVETYDYFGHELYDNTNTIDDHDGGVSWEELGKDEEEYITNNGGDWILDN